MGGWEVALFGGSWWWVVGCLEDWGGWSWVRSHGCHGLAVGISPLSGSGAFSVWPPPPRMPLGSGLIGVLVPVQPCALAKLAHGLQRVRRLVVELRGWWLHLGWFWRWGHGWRREWVDTEEEGR